MENKFTIVVPWFGETEKVTSVKLSKHTRKQVS